MNLGYRYLSPEQCLNLRSPKGTRVQTQADSAGNSSNQVMLLPMLRQYLTTTKLSYAEAYIAFKRKQSGSSVILEL
ncbi:hypothetical protein SAMN04488491_0743 [Psychrobacter sp. LV10R520-6]|nr:hypothetical protein SAMN04488491_0743 [Psychrobacter sp. LV10R520-6]